MERAPRPLVFEMQEIAGPLVDFIIAAYGFIGRQLLQVVQYPIDPSQRIYALYLFTSLLFATAVYLKRYRSREIASYVSFHAKRGAYSDLAFDPT